jgi:hypothetical protein
VYGEGRHADPKVLSSLKETNAVYTSGEGMEVNKSTSCFSYFGYTLRSGTAGLNTIPLAIKCQNERLFWRV